MIPQKQHVLIFFDVVLNHTQKAHTYNMKCASNKMAFVFINRIIFRFQTKMAYWSVVWYIQLYKRSTQCGKNVGYVACISTIVAYNEIRFDLFNFLPL